jgi:hypothetical protein
MGEVLHMVDVQPKTLNRSYKNQKIKITYLPPTKTWRWEVFITTTAHFDGEAKTRQAAVKEAEKMIDMATRHKK